MPCRVRTFLNDHIGPGDREQFAIILNDPTRHVENLARSIEHLMPDMTGVDILKHRHHTCDCYGWVD